MHINNIYYHPKRKFNARVFNWQEGYCLDSSIGPLEHKIETGIYLQGMDEKEYFISIDLSTMSGCLCKCLFCAASSSYKYTLTSEQLVDQLQGALDYIQKERGDFFTKSELISISFTGMGETSHPSVIVNILKSMPEMKKIIKKHRKKLHFLISTMGYNPLAIDELANSDIPIETLQISLHAVNENLREKIFGGLSSNLDSIMQHVDAFHNKHPKTLIKFNYLMINIDGHSNISEDDLKILKNYLRNNDYFIKLSHLNETETSVRNNITSPTSEEILDAYNFLASSHPNTYLYGSTVDLGISCGQLYVNRKII